jgi:NADH-quinone oxidoreductase subunit L
VLPVSDSTNRGIISKFIYRKFYFDEIYNFFIIKPYQWFAEKFTSFIETNIIDSIINGIGSIVVFVGNKARLIQNGNIGFYMFVMIIAMISMIAGIIWLK